MWKRDLFVNKFLYHNDDIQIILLWGSLMQFWLDNFMAL